MIGQLTIGLVFALALWVGLAKGIRWAYVLVFLPTLVLLNQLPSVNIQHAPVQAEYAPMYAILIAALIRGDSLRFRVCLADVAVVLLLVSATLTALTTEYLETAVNVCRNEFLRIVMPYLLARIVFQDWQARRAAVGVMAAVMVVVGLAALVEVRLTPYFYLHVLERLGMDNFVPVMAYTRLGFYRVSGVLNQPIFFGNLCLGLLGLMAALAATSGLPLTSKRVAVGLAATLGCVVVSLSYTPYVGLLLGGAGLLVLVGFPVARRLVLAGTLAAMAAGVGYTAYIGTRPLAEREYGEVAGSYWTRQLIIHQSWGVATSAGPFGYGLRADFSGTTDFDLASVDNTYLQFTMTRGWAYTGLWLSLGVLFAWRAQRAFAAMTDPRTQALPVAVCTATVLGLMAAMYTVFGGNQYAIVWFIVMGLGHTLIDAIVHAPAAVPAAAAAGRLVRPPTVRLGSPGRPALAQ